ncbi:hypothetical protein [Vulcanisaeta sp. JCM 14467]
MFIEHTYEGNDYINPRVMAIVGLITSIALLLFIRLIRPIDLVLHRDLVGVGLFLVSILFFLWMLVTSMRSGRVILHSGALKL